MGVWTNGSLVGRWVIPASGPMEFTYDPARVASSEARPLSLSLPMNLDGVPLKGERVGFFFDNLLPDSEVIRRRIQSRFHTQKGDGEQKVALLRAVERAGRSLPTRVALRVLGLKPGRFRAWHRAEACHLDDRSSCPKTRPMQLASLEIRAMREMVTSPDLRHFSIRALAMHAQRIGRVFASPGRHLVASHPPARVGSTASSLVPAEAEA